MEFSFTFEGVIRGHHVYKFVWTPFIGEILLLQKIEMKMILMLQMTKACAYNQGMLIQY